MEEADFAHGEYTHFKGGRYATLLLTRDCETVDPVVVYISLSTFRVWTRTLKEFKAVVIDPANGKVRERFELVREISFWKRLYLIWRYLH